MTKYVKIQAETIKVWGTKMTKYTVGSTGSEVEAVQWFKGGDHPAVKVHIFLENLGDLGIIHYIKDEECWGNQEVKPSDWILTIDSTKEDGVKRYYIQDDESFRRTYREVKPVVKEQEYYSCSLVAGQDSVRALQWFKEGDHPDVNNRGLFKWEYQLDNSSFLKLDEVVKPSDWIITTSTGYHFVVGNKYFRENYRKVEPVDTKAEKSEYIFRSSASYAMENVEDIAKRVCTFFMWKDLSHSVYLLVRSSKTLEIYLRLRVYTDSPNNILRKIKDTSDIILAYMMQEYTEVILCTPEQYSKLQSKPKAPEIPDRPAPETTLTKVLKTVRRQDLEIIENLLCDFQDSYGGTSYWNRNCLAQIEQSLSLLRKCLGGSNGR